MTGSPGRHILGLSCPSYSRLVVFFLPVSCRPHLWLIIPLISAIPAMLHPVKRVPIPCVRTPFMHCFFHGPSLAPASAHRHGGKADQQCNDRLRLTACPDKDSVQFFQAPANRRACDSFFTRLRSVVVFFCMFCPEELLSHSTSSSCLFYARRMLVQSRIRLCMFGHFQHSQAAGASARYHSAQYSHSVLSVNTPRSSHPISNAIPLALSAQLTNAAATVNSTLATPPPSPPARSPATLAPVPATSLSTPTHSSTARSSVTNSSVSSMNSPPGLLKPSSSRSTWPCPRRRS